LAKSLWEKNSKKNEVALRDPMRARKKGHLGKRAGEVAQRTNRESHSPNAVPKEGMNLSFLDWRKRRGSQFRSPLGGNKWGPGESGKRPASYNWLQKKKKGNQRWKKGAEDVQERQRTRRQRGGSGIKGKKHGTKRKSGYDRISKGKVGHITRRNPRSLFLKKRKLDPTVRRGGTMKREENANEGKNSACERSDRRVPVEFKGGQLGTEDRVTKEGSQKKGGGEKVNFTLGGESAKVKNDTEPAEKMKGKKNGGSDNSFDSKNGHRGTSGREDQKGSRGVGGVKGWTFNEKGGKNNQN